jgi:hypothetical protein
VKKDQQLVGPRFLKTLHMNFADYETGVASRIQDSANKLSQADRDDAITQAVKRYSKDRPRELVTDIPGADPASSLLGLPAGPSDPAEQFEDGFSIIRAIEFPVGDMPPTYLEGEDWLLYRTPAGLKIALTDMVPQASDILRVTWTVRHNPGTSGQGAVATTVPDSDFEAVCDLAASFCCDKLAAAFARTNDSTIQADTVNYRTKSQEYAALGKQFKNRYDDHIGIEDGGAGTSGSPAAGAMAIGDMNLTKGSGVDRLTHRRPR